MTNYTTNLVPNPNFASGTTAGYTALTGTTLATDGTQAMFISLSSMSVTTDGTVPGEGFYTPAGTISPAATCSVSLFLMGDTGTVNVSAVYNPGGNVVQTVTVQLQPAFSRVILDGLAIPNNGQLYILVTTPTAQNLTFNVAGVQIEPESPHTDYCDGDQPECFWTGTPKASISYRPAQFGVSGALQVIFSGSATAYIPGAIFFESGAMGATWSGTATPLVLSPAAAVDAFAIYGLTDPDPAMTYAYDNNAGVTLSTTAWTRAYSAFVPPLDYPVSGGGYAWRRAAFGAFGFSYASVPASQGVQLTKAQVEMAHLNGTTVTPATWDQPRAIHTIVKPDFLNYITNPSFETSTAGWSAIGACTLAQDSTHFAPGVSVFDSVEYNAGTSSLKVTLNNSTGQGAQISVPLLIAGRTYTASCWVMPGSNINDISGTCAGGGADVQNTGQPYGGNAITGIGFGQGYYGGVAPSGSALAPMVWTHLSFNFTATADTHTFQITALPVTGVTYPVNFWIDAVMINEGDTLAQYFDGNFGADAFWESTANLSRSYYYKQYAIKQRIVSDVLARHTPLGINYETPVFDVPYTQ